MSEYSWANQPADHVQLLAEFTAAMREAHSKRPAFAVEASPIERLEGIPVSDRCIGARTELSGAIGDLADLLRELGCLDAEAPR